MAEELKTERFVNVTTMIRYHNDKMIEAFNRFVTFCIAINGGAYWLLTQKDLPQVIKVKSLTIVTSLIWFLGISSALLIYSNWLSWYGYRKAEHKLMPLAVPEPKIARAFKEQMIMLLVILCVCSFYSWLSPLQFLTSQASGTP